MFPSWSYDQTTSSGSPSPPAETPNSAFGMLLDAANANDSPRLQAMMTPPQSPESRSLMGLDETDAHGISLRMCANLSRPSEQTSIGWVIGVYTELSPRASLTMVHFIDRRYPEDVERSDSCCICILLETYHISSS
jgi:hypothetical protein